MSAPTATQLISEQDYRDAEEIGLQKHEWFDGKTAQFPIQSNNHTILCGNVLFSLAPKLRGTNFRARNSEQRVKIAATGLETYPDALIFELPGQYIGRGDSTLLNPKILFEVLSPSTEKYDRRGKWEHYKRIETLTNYVLIDQDSVSVEHFARVGSEWNFRLYIRRTDALPLESVGISLALGEIYEELDVPEPLLIFEPGNEI